MHSTRHSDYPMIREYMARMTYRDDRIEELETALSHARSSPALAAGVAVPKGYALVPVEPTHEMLCAGANNINGIVNKVWAAMLAAAPQQKE